MSERVSWITCPHCDAPVALGWQGSTPVEFDCRSGCRITGVDLAAHFPGPSRAPFERDRPRLQAPRCQDADDPLG